MHLVLFLIWYMIAILPTFIIIEGTDMLSKFLKKKNIYHYWDFWHSLLLLLIIFAIIVYSAGY